MDSVIKASDLVAGDVLLYKGTGFISRAIQFFDGTDFSHAALYLGDGRVGEAIATGLKRRDYVEGAADIWVQAHRLKDVVPTMEPVLEVANAYLDEGNRYGYEQLLLLAFLCLTRKLRFTPSLRRLIRTVLDASAAVLTRMLSENREPMICSEFVYRAYDEAMPGSDDLYSLWINRLFASAETGLARAMAPGLEGGAPLPPVKGQGIHPQSLLALVNSSSGSAWVGPARAEMTFAAREEAEVDADQLEAAVEAYLGEIQDKPEALPMMAAAPEPSLAELRDATQDFAASLYAATHPEDEALMAMVTPATVVTISTYLTQVAADFVTPGDLYKTQSLYELGRVEM
jgi:hypothetical protein